MGTQCLPDSLRELLGEWYSSSIHPHTNTPYSSPKHQWKQGAITNYLPPQPVLFWISLAFGRTALFLSSLLVAFSQEYIYLLYSEF